MDECMRKRRNVCCVYACLNVCAHVQNVTFCTLSLQALEYLPFEGTVSLKSPQHVFCLLEDYGTDPNNIPEHPDYIYFGRWVRRQLLTVCLFTFD